MHYPIDEKTKKPYGMSKGVKLESIKSLEEVESERKAAEEKRVADREKAFFKANNPKLTPEKKKK